MWINIGYVDSLECYIHGINYEESKKDLENKVKLIAKRLLLDISKDIEITKEKYIRVYERSCCEYGDRLEERYEYFTMQEFKDNMVNGRFHEYDHIEYDDEDIIYWDKFQADIFILDEQFYEVI